VCQAVCVWLDYFLVDEARKLKTQARDVSREVSFYALLEKSASRLEA
jgi:hypothetical protein